MNKHCKYQRDRSSYSLEDVLSDDIRHVIQRTVQEGRTSICEGYIWRNCASSPEFILACEAAKESGLQVTV